MEQLSATKYKFDFLSDWAEVDRTVLSLKRWGGERSIDFQPKVLLPDAKLNVAQDSVFYGNTKLALKSHDLVPKNKGSLGSFEFEIIFFSRPAFNKIDLDINTTGLVAYCQFPLTQMRTSGWSDEFGKRIVVSEREIRGEDGFLHNFMPENVLGSYAFYHDTRKGLYKGISDAEKYKSGKAFHLFRPQLKDALGRTSWATLNLVGNTLTIIFDPTWLDAATYPIVVDPNFGYETAGAQTTGNWHKCFGWEATPASAGTLDSVSSYIDGNGITGGGAVYIDSTGTGNKVRVAASSNSVLSADPAWNTRTLGGEAITVQTYILGIGGTGGTFATWYYDNALISDYYDSADWTGTWGDPHSWAQNNWWKYSAYATYTETGAGTILPQMMAHHGG